jgi:hypothetical protein
MIRFPLDDVSGILAEMGFFYSLNAKLTGSR